MLHQEGETEADLMELKTELKTVVEALSFLQDFVESVFGAKYRNFVGVDLPSGGISITPSHGGCSSASSIKTALRRLQWKHSKGTEESFELPSSTAADGSRRDSRGDNGYSSGGTPISDGRRSSVSSQNKVFSPIETEHGVKVESNEVDEDSCRFSMSIGRPEVVAVKCEVEDTDFLDDMDPFGSESANYLYEGEESEIKIENCYPISALPVSSSPMELSLSKSPIISDLPSNHGTNPPSHRFLPELIPIQTDSHLPEVIATIPVCKEEDDEDSGTTSSSDNSDTEWHPSSSITSTASKRSKQDSKRRAFPKSTKRSTNLPNNNYPSARTSLPSFAATGYGQLSLPRSLPSSSGLGGGGTGGGGPFKCDMCPASYKQEESLRSHQKYKHNPSRIQCTCHLCGKSMVDKYRLQRHLRLHTGEKPFECEYCGQSFYRKDYHTKHLQRKHGIVNNSTLRHPPPEAPPPSSRVGRSAGQKSQLSYTSLFPPKSLPNSSSPTAFSNLMSNIFETPSHSPISPLRKSPASGHIGPGMTLTSLSTSPPSSSVSPGTTISSTASVGVVGKEQCNFVDVFSSHSSGHSGEGGGDGGNSRFGDPVGAFPGTGTINNLMTMTSLTFDDLISADL